MPRFLGRLEYLRLATIGIDAALIVVAYWGAFMLRFDGQIPPIELALLYETLPWVVAIQMILYFEFHLNQTIWRYVGLWDALKIAEASATGMIVALAAVLYLRVPEFPRSLFPLDLILQLSFLSGARVLRRIANDLHKADRGKRILIFGAGDAGEMIVRDMKHNPYHGYSPVGFIDDDPAKIGTRIHGVPVLGSRNALRSADRNAASAFQDHPRHREMFGSVPSSDQDATQPARPDRWCGQRFQDAQRVARGLAHQGTGRC